MSNSNLGYIEVKLSYSNSYQVIQIAIKLFK